MAITIFRSVSVNFSVNFSVNSRVTFTPPTVPFTGLFIGTPFVVTPTNGFLFTTALKSTPSVNAGADRPFFAQSFATSSVQVPIFSIYPFRYIGIATSSFGGRDVCGLRSMSTAHPRGNEPGFQISSRSENNITCTLAWLA